MKVILLKDVPKIGHKNDVKEVADGYARNFLIPHKLAIFANDGAIKEAEVRAKKMQDERKVHEDLLRKTFEDVKGKAITLKEKANDQGHLFAGIQSDEIALSIKDQTGLSVNPEHIVIPHPIKELGEHKLTLQSHGVSVEFIIKVESV